MCRFTLDSATESRIASEIPDVCATAPGVGGRLRINEVATIGLYLGTKRFIDPDWRASTI